MKEIFSTSDILVIISTSVFLSVLLSLLISKLKKKRYDDVNNRALIDDMRKYYESQIYRLNDRMMGTESRFRDLNHLLIRDDVKDIDLRADPIKVKMNNFLFSNGLTESDLVTKKNMIFVLTPFHSQFEREYQIIRNTCLEVGFECVRGDEQHFTSDIFSQILKKIVESRIIIANVSGRNPNVLYELGIAHALDKPTILITKSAVELPVDLKSKRFIVYSSQKELSSLLRRELIKILQ